MQRFFHRVLFAGLTSLMLVPVASMAQDQVSSQEQSSPAQADSQTAGRQGGARFAAMQRQRRHMAMLAKKLNLTDAQKQQFQQISKDMRKQGMAIRQDSSLTDQQKKEKMQALRKQSHQQMFSILTAEQKEQLRQMREQHKEQEKQKPSGDQASTKKPGTNSDDDDPFAGMTSDDDGPGNGGRL